MWNMNQKRTSEFYGVDPLTMDFSFAFPRLPPNITNSSPISKTHMIKDEIIRDNASMLARLYDFHTAFQQYAEGLFGLMPPNQFGPGHPMRSRMSPAMYLESENKQLKKENVALKKELEKLKQK